MAPKTHQTTGEMEKRQIVLRFFLPANEQTAKAIQPGMNSFHHPAASFEARFAFDGLGLFPSRAHMGCKAKFLQNGVHLIVVVPFVQTHPLWMCLGGLGAVDDDAFDGRAHQSHIMAVRSLNHRANRHSMSLRQHAAFDAPLAAISGIGPGFFPPPTELLSLLHPSRASPTPSPTTHRISQLRLAQALEKSPLPP